MWTKFCMRFITTAEIYYVDAINQDDIFLYCKYMQQSDNCMNLKTIWSSEEFNKTRENEISLCNLDNSNKNRKLEIFSLMNSFPITFKLTKNTNNEIDSSRKKELEFMNNWSDDENLNSSVFLRDDVNSCDITMCSSLRFDSTIDENGLTGAGCLCFFSGDVDVKCFPF